MGPNGSGKSNIVDGILWAMGEGRASLLRASRMEDVIFKGSSSRAPLSRAEVLLNFVHGEESLTIGRRIYRDGESEFLINGSPVRLRDVQDKLREIGIEAREYVVIEQGQVEALLNMNPEERMVFLEALAGVTMYKERRREALRNLLRVEEKLSLVRMREEEVRSSHEKALRELEVLEKYRELTLKLEKLTSTLLLKRREKILSSLREISEEEGKIQERLLGITSRREEALQRARELSEEKAGLLERINHLERRRGEIKRERSEISSEIISLTGEISSLEEKIQGAKRRKAEFSSKKKYLEERLSRNRELLERERKKYLELHGKYETLKVRVKEMEDEVEAGRKNYLEKMSLYRQKLSLQEERRKQRERRAERLKRAQKEKEEAKGELALLQSREIPFPEDLTPLQQEIEAKKRELEEVLRERSVMEERLRQVRRTMEFLQKAVEGKKLRKIKIKEEYSDLAEILWERELSASPLEGENPAPGLYLLGKNWASEEFKKRAGAEVPFRDALWRENLKEAVDAWRETAKPVVFPHGVIFPEGVLKIKGEAPGALSLLLKLQELRKESQGMEGELVKLREREATLKKGLKELKTRLGELEKRKEKAKKEREKRLERINLLRERIAALEREIRELSSEESSWDEEDLSPLQRELEGLEAQLKEKEDMLKRERARLSEVNTELRVCNREIVRLEEEIKKDRETLERSLNEKEGLEERTFRLSQRLSRLREKLRDRKGREGKLRLEEEGLEKEISELLQQNSRIEEELRSMDRKLERLRKEEGRLKDRLAQVKSREAELRERLENLKREALDRVGRPLLSLKLHYKLTQEELEKEIAEAEEERSLLGEINFKAEREEKELREQLEEIQSQRRDLEGSVAKAKQTLDQMEETYRDKISGAFSQLQQTYADLFASVAEGEVILEMEQGLHIKVRFRGKKFQPLSMLSGGERALASLLFHIALFRIKPAPFLILDEVDAPLDLPNIQKLTSLIKQLRDETQIIMITHNPATARHADFIYGVSMPEDGTSRVYSVRSQDLFNME